MSQLEDNLSFLGTANTLMISILVISFISSYFLLALPLQRSLKHFHALLYIIPLEVIDSNMLLKQSLMRVRYGEFFFKLKN